ncbi:PREDICTED: laminin subunit alpha-1 isoform X2 [Dinoponera quadriceps]|uniref:Laminin subunit alpha-1 isoform X2 n=1 Tax=Dinoponera quadriceps TaxID=609295 RepID=A0A6P3X5L1_DINQU|nr:PREDICTED: laminin subunit alpha-1 isoform X2 [Dinoponera quadriceps]
MAAARRLADAVTLVVVVLLILHRDLHAVQARGFRRSLNHVPASTFKNSSLFPPIFNVAAKAEIYVNATCGEHGPETFCKPSEPSRCAVCDSRSPDAGKRHHISNVLHLNSGRWWQSPTIARGDRYEYVTILLDLKQVYQVEYVIVKAANSPRPAAWILEKSLDGENFLPWQYYAPSDEECWLRYSTSPALGKAIFINDDDIICTSQHSKQTPMENGEIHTYLVSGRPGALSHSSTLLEFTQARYVRLRLQGLQRSVESSADKRQAFYSIKEINIGGRCPCSGHAARCRHSVHHGHQECECERHTCGERCEKCCPMYNQIPWRPGTADKGFRCEVCNCNGHATSCRYDQEVDRRGMSMDIHGEYRGGGVCVNCTKHTTGINCETCEVGYYRPNGVAPDAPEPCVPCNCDSHGSTGYCTPDDSYTSVGKVAGACECKPGYSGYMCNQCAAGYQQFPDCMPCPCDSRGILPSDDCEGDCLCKTNVAGEFCDRCKPGYFALTKSNIDGCSPCYCFGRTDRCTSARLSYNMVSTLENWLVTDMNASRAVVPTLMTDDGWLTVTADEVEYSSPFWLAPQVYIGNLISSYGSNLTYSVTWAVIRGDSSGKPTIEPNVILISNNGLRIAYGEEQYSSVKAEVSVSLREHGWYHVRDEIRDIPTRLRRTEYRGDPVTKAQMMRVLADLKHLMIRAKYHSEQIEGNLQFAVLTTAELSPDGKINNLIEKCECPEGYEGLSCEKCAWGYAKVITNSTHFQDHHICVKCDCNGHVGSCDLLMGECGTCLHHTVGPKCDRCAVGYYGIATKGTSEDCKKCACPLFIESNNFSPSCQLDDPTDINSGYVCTQCPEGYTDDHCESCDVGFYGNPLTPGGTCQRCLCNGGACDQETGRCLECRGNTEGWKCDRCKEAHFGDPLKLNCMPCDCSPLGSNSAQCDRVTGQCPCGSLFAGRDCSSCIEGYGNVTAGCRECDCDVGALGGLCDPVSGVCRCAPGVVGSRCDRCDADHYGLTSDGCKGCGCNNMGSSSSACDIVSGQCQCKPQVVGRQCNECKIGYWGLASGTGCASCSCDLMGSRNVSCHSNTGQCYCKPGVGGTICDTCLSGYYGFSANGCQLCDPCVRPGHVCDPDTGRCVCPSLTYGEHCDRCRPGAWNLVPRVGCRPCACTLGTTRPQCDHQGQCPCRIGYDGLRCERCTKGYYGYPRCRPCSCNVAGITQCGDGVCECDDKGQCPCKELVVGRQCDQCKEGTFGLATSNARGCTECFCFGRSALCRQARLSWGQRRLTHPRVLYINETVHDITITNFGATNVLPTVNGGLNVTNGLSVIPGSDGDVTLSSNLYYNYPLYWKLPDSFLGDKVVSYGGFLRFNVSTEGGIPLRTSLRYPLVQMQGNSKIVLEYYLRAPVSDENRYEIRLHESLWQLQNRPDYKVSREVLMVALQNLQHILVKASDNIEFTRTTLLEASLDAAVLTPTHSPSLAIGVEICECPAEYNGTSCQDPSIGYYRWHMNTTATSTGVLDLVGQARRCQCSGRSDVCDRETGYCLNCREYTTGARCDVCADSFYGHPEFGGCRPCPCPQVDKSFSSTCVIRTGNEPICHCKPGYTGRKCEYCSYGYYGSPNLPDGKCVPCNCNLAGSLSDACDGETGQCKCRPGSTGRDCSECTAYRHVYINDVCTTCDDNCTGILLDTVETLSAKLAGGTSHIVDGSILPPWDELAYVNANATEYLGELELRDRLQQRMKNVPWHQHMKLMKDVEAMLRNANIHARHADTLKTRSSDLKNNIFSSKIEIEKLHRNIKDTISQLNQYSSDNKRIGIKKALKTGKMILSYLKSVDISKRTMEVEDFLDEVAEYVAWLNSLEDATEPLAAAQDDAEDYEVKLKDVRTIVEDTMETLFSYDGLYNSINRTLVETKQQCIRIGTLRDETNKSVAEGEDLVDQARGFLVDAENNVQDLPSLRDKLAHWKEKLTMREEILYRLNYEYNQQYVIPAVTHAKNLSNYADQYVSLFAETRDIAASPLKASQAYKNIVDGLKAAKVTALAAKTAIEEVYAKVFPPSERKSLLDEAKEAFSKTSRQWETAKEHNKLVKKASAEVEAQKRAVYTLKDTLNSTGIRDNQINVKLRELQGSSKKFHEDVQNILNENDEVTESIRNKQRLIDDYNQGIADRLRPKLNELKREGDSKISLASEKLTEALSNIKKADAKLISLSNAAMKRKAVFDKWNDTLATKLQNLKDKIAEARNTADGIRVSLKSAQDKQCIRSYRPETLQPSATSSIVMTFALPAGRKDGSLFYLPSGINDDFIALEIVDRRVRFLWNVGGGTGLLTHPEVLESGDPQNDTFWYRIEAERTRHVGKLSVRKQISTSGKYLPVVNSTNSEYGRFDILPTDRVWIGGIPKSQKKPTELIAPNGLAGCVHQVIFDGKQIGLWNFVSTAPDMACAACVEGVEAARDDIAYSFNGKGYAVRNRVSSAPYSKYMFGVSFSFRTYDENALLFLAINPDNNQHIMIYLREGRVILDVGYGGNVSIEMSSTYKYNTGNWTKVDAGRQYQVQKHIEKCSLSIDSDDKRIGAPTPQPRKEDLPNLAQAKYYIGGLPPSFRADEVLPSQVSFLGCMSNLVVQQGYDPMAELYYGVEPSCRRKPLKIVGFYGDGYLEHPAYTLRKKHSVLSFSFRTPQEAAMLLLSTFEGNEDRPSVGNTGQGENNNYYSVCIVNGQVQVRLNAGQGELVLQSNSTFNDGRYHSVTVIKRRKEVELRIDDAYQSTGRLATSAAIKAPSANKGLFFGGLPALINNTKMVTTNTPLYGAIKDVIVNDEILRFDDAINFDHALIGRSGPSMGKDPPSYVPSASLSRGMSTQPEGCQKVPYYSLEPGALKFGDKPHSHTQLYLNFKKFWEKDYVIEFDFRTYYPNGLLFITPGLRLRNYLMVVIQDGQLLLLLKGKQHREMLFKTPFNDGNWHHVVLSREERKLTLLVDTQTPRTLKLPRRAGLASMMYIGGLPENGTPLPDNVVTKLETLKGCIRGLRVNGNVYDMVGSTSRAFNVGQCFPSVESGAYFQDEAYAIYQENFELGAVLELQLEFRTSELSGVLLSISAPDGSPSLALELNNGRVIMSGDLGDNNPLYVEQRFASPYAICDNRWHRIQAVYNDEELALKVDELDQKYGLPTKANYHFADSTTYGPLYIGGIPASAQKGSLITRDHFNGCIRNVMIGGERRDWTDMAELHNIHLSSCPVQ